MNMIDNLFLDKIAKELKLSEFETEIFKVSINNKLEKKDEQKTNEELRKLLPVSKLTSKSTFERNLKSIYRKFSSVCPELRQRDVKGKIEILLAYLAKENQSPHITIHNDTKFDIYRLIREGRDSRSISLSSSKKIKHTLIKIAAVLNGNALYTSDIKNGIRQRTESGLSETNFAIVVKDFIGHPENTSDSLNKKIFDDVVKFQPNIIITIGSQVSITGKEICREKGIPVIAVGVASPIKLNLINETTMQAEDRLDLACVRYGIGIEKIMDFLSILFDNNDNIFYYFIYNSNYIQDDIRAKEIQEIIERENIQNIKILKLDKPHLPTELNKRGNIFFGFYFLHLNLVEFMSSSSYASFIGVSSNDTCLGAIASIIQDDYSLGVLTADEILIPWILNEKTNLNNIRLIEPKIYYTLNLKISEDKKLRFSDKAIDIADEIFVGD